MFGYNHVFQHKFRDGAAATDYADSARWTYAGQRGFIAKRHVYSGCSIYHRGSPSGPLQVDELRLTVGNDGATTLFAAKSSKLLATSGLPDNVWPSLDVYEHVARIVERSNSEIEDSGSAIRCFGNQDFRVEGDDRASRFTTPAEALKWVKDRAR